MTVYGQADVGFVFIDGNDIKGNLLTLESHADALVEQSDTLGDSWEEHAAVGVSRMNLALDGFYDDAAGALDATFAAMSGAARIMLVSIATNAVGKPAIGFQGPIVAGYQRIAQRGQLHKAKPTIVGSGARTDLIILAALATRTSTSSTDGTSYNSITVTSANGGIFNVQVSAFAPAGGGGTNCLIKWRHSSDNITFVNIAGTVVTVTTAPSAARVDWIGTLLQYWSVNWVFDGSGGSPSITFAAAAARKP